MPPRPPTTSSGPKRILAPDLPGPTTSGSGDVYLVALPLAAGITELYLNSDTIKTPGQTLTQTPSNWLVTPDGQFLKVTSDAIVVVLLNINGVRTNYVLVEVTAPKGTIAEGTRLRLSSAGPPTIVPLPPGYDRTNPSLLPETTRPELLPNP